MRTACLIGNGVSTAYNPALAVPSLTTELIEHLGKLGDGDAETALSRFALQVTGEVPGEQFEALLGPLSSSASALDRVAELASIARFAPKDKIIDGISTTASFLREIHRLGLGTVLGSIAAHANGESDTFQTVTEPLAEALIALGPAGNLTLATLNYDGLTHAGLMEAGRDLFGRSAFSIADLANGQTAMREQVLPGALLSGHWLRESDDIPGDRAALLHLHGYLGWLRQPKTGRVAKFTLEHLRKRSYWKQFAAGETDWEPVVVLTDRKSRAALEWPISLAYESFLARLVAADRWMIAGYGLGDAPVNKLYRAASRARMRLGLRAPRVFVIGLGSEHPKVMAAEARRALGLPIAPGVSMVGVPDAFDTRGWNDFAAE